MILSGNSAPTRACVPRWAGPNHHIAPPGHIRPRSARHDPATGCLAAPCRALMLASIPGFQPGQAHQTRPRSWVSSRSVASARDSPPVSPVLSVSTRSSAAPGGPSSRLNPARGAPGDHTGGFSNAQRNVVTAAAIAITLTRRIAEPGRTEQPFRRGKMAATGPGRADHIGGSTRAGRRHRSN